MQLQLRSVFVVFVWTALCCAAISGTVYATEFLVLVEFFALSVCLAIGLFGSERERLFCGCFASGFLSWILLCATESWFGGLHRFSSSTPSRVSAVSIWLLELTSHSDNVEKSLHFSRIETVTRLAFGNIFGIVTYLLAFGWLRSTEEHNKAKDPT